ncbi:hypothetical protein [Streptomyces sp. NBC_00470]|uniref:hypothetical protein n=1 Tax=Streptomyces sp. NBC_00470 TaxID=2975753 RepID=UPI002F9172C7
MFLTLTTPRDDDGYPLVTVTAQFVGGPRDHTWLVVATTPNNTEDTADLYPYGPFTTEDGARDWAEAHLAPHSTYTVVPLTTPYTDADVEAELGKPNPPHKEPRPTRSHTVARILTASPYNLTRLRHTTRPDTRRRGFTAREVEDPELGPVVRLTALGPHRDRDHASIRSILRHEHPRYTVTDHGTHLHVRLRPDAELHAAADQAALHAAPTLPTPDEEHRADQAVDGLPADWQRAARRCID